MAGCVVAVVAACGDRGPPASDAPDPAVCAAELEAALDRQCTAPADCVLVSHDDCCGIVRYAVRAGTEAGFPAAEAAYQACRSCPPLGCSHADQAEDGRVPSGGQAIVPTCVAKRCTSVVQ